MNAHFRPAFVSPRAAISSRAFGDSQRADSGRRAIDPRHAEVYVLADQGHSPHAIAQRLERPYGEIELILALRDKGAAL